MSSHIACGHVYCCHKQATLGDSPGASDTCSQGVAGLLCAARVAEHIHDCHGLMTFWNVQHGGYEVYIVEGTNVSNEQCLHRNIHHRTMEDIAMAAEQWQPTPPTYPLLDLGSLLGVNKKKTKQVSTVTSC